MPSTSARLALANVGCVFGLDCVQFLVGRSQCLPGLGDGGVHFMVRIAEGVLELVASLSKCRFRFCQRPGDLRTMFGGKVPVDLRLCRIHAVAVRRRRRLRRSKVHPRFLVPPWSDDPECHGDDQDQENDAFHVSSIQERSAFEDATKRTVYRGFAFPILSEG
jgi:hypothetical protein